MRRANPTVANTPAKIEPPGTNTSRAPASKSPVRTLAVGAMRPCMESIDIATSPVDAPETPTHMHPKMHPVRDPSAQSPALSSDHTGPGAGMQGA
jgi:hypothetical protein